MYAKQNLPIAFPIPSSLFDTLPRLWRRMARHVRESRDAARRKQAIDALPQHLRYDAGYSAYRLPPSGPALDPHGRQSPEAPWLAQRLREMDGAARWREGF